MVFRKSLRSVSKCVRLIPFACHLSARFLILKKKITDVIASDSPSRHPGTPEEEGLRFASPKDIAAMKVNAVMGRGTKKDFIDVYFLLKHYSFDELIQFYLQKYTDGSEYRALLSMSYFADADPQPMPYMFQDVDWEMIKSEIKQRVELYNREHL